MVSTFEDAASTKRPLTSASAPRPFIGSTKILRSRKLLPVRPGGWWTMVWNVFGDSSRPDPFHEATKMLLGEPRGPSAGTGGVPSRWTARHVSGL